MRHRATQDEAARLDPGHLVDFIAGERLHQLVHRAAEGARVAQQGGDVAEHDPGLGIVGNGADDLRKVHEPRRLSPSLGGLAMVEGRCAEFAAAVAFAAISAAAWPASAGTAKCWIDNGAVVVPALAGDIAGDFILDLSAPHSQLHDTSAQSHGLGDATELQTPVTLAGERIPGKLAIIDLDDRGWASQSGSTA